MKIQSAMIVGMGLKIPYLQSRKSWIIWRGLLSSLHWTLIVDIGKWGWNQRHVKSQLLLFLWVCSSLRLCLLASIEAMWKAQQGGNENGKVVISPNISFIVMEDLLYCVITFPHKTIYQLYIPVNFRTHILTYFHQDPLSGHLGRHKTYRRLQHMVYWPKLSLDIGHHVQSCQVYQLYKPENRKSAGKLQQTLVQ